MSFLYPLGLLGLIGIPILIIIYIIKNKYTEQVIPATYLWTLSERFLKRKNPINRLNGIISLILQILIVAFAAFAIAHPVFVLANAAEDYVFVLDGSGSMNMLENGKTRLEVGKSHILSLISDSANGSSYTLVFVGDSTDLIFEQVEEKSQAKELVSSLSSAYTSTGLVDALGVAQSYFDENPAVKTYLVTDKSYETSENVEVVNVGSSVQNYAISEVSYSISDSIVTVSGTAFSYESDTTLHIDLYEDNATTASATTEVSVEKLVGASFSLTSSNTAFGSLRVVIREEDALSLDNEVVLYNERSDSSYRTLIVSDSEFFLKSVLTAVGGMQIDTVSTEKYTETSGYGLYVFDGYSPAVLPSDGAVWFFNPTESVANSGFTVQNETTPLDTLVMKYSTSSATTVRTLLKDVPQTDLYVTLYRKCSFRRNFTTLLTLEGDPMLFVGTNSYGNREVVFSFDVHNSNLAQSLVEFVTLTNNLINYTFPAVLDETEYYCGESVVINVLAGCTYLRVETPLGNVEYLDTSSAVTEYDLNEVGVYTVIETLGDTQRRVELYSALPESERVPTVAETDFSLRGEPSSDRRDGKFDDLIYLFILLAVVFLADWGLYCYEQYQLR